MFMQQTHYPVSAAAMQKSTVVAINTHHFLTILKQSMDTCLLIMGDLSRRMHELINEIDKLSSLSGRNRVATYMLEQSMQKGLEFKLEIPKNAIASMLSLQPETFSRLLRELCSKKAIQVKDSNIRILDKNRLRNFAGLIN
jgi:CRP-like cAMP-binding protein